MPGEGSGGPFSSLLNGPPGPRFAFGGLHNAPSSIYIYLLLAYLFRFREGLNLQTCYEPVAEKRPFKPPNSQEVQK